MRFAIALLTIICVASVIGTVVKQGEPLVNYVDAFGPFWTEVFDTLGLFRIYSAGWFLLILAFLVLSTSLCIARNAPKFWADFNTHKAHIRVQALQAFHHKAQGQTPLLLADAQAQVVQVLTASGWQIKTQSRDGSTSEGGPGVMVAARKGRANRLGYIAAHMAVVLICVGGLLDGDLISALQAKWLHLTPYRGGDEISQHSLSARNPAFRAQLFVPEGQQSAQSVLNLARGMFVQPLPFAVELKKFKVEFYETGMPKRFASDIVIHDPRDKSQHASTVEVNHPIVYDGYTIFQSGFEDGGSTVALTPLPLNLPPQQASGLKALMDMPLNLVVGQEGVALPAPLTPGASLRLELTALRPINVEDRGSNDVAPSKSWTQYLGSGERKDGNKHLVNVGPSITYKLRDTANQAREYQNYMLPSSIDGVTLFLLGVRESANEPFQYLRVPADENMQIKGWVRLRQALGDSALRLKAAQVLTQARTATEQAALRQQLQDSTLRVLDLFAGQGPLSQADTTKQVPQGGFDALSTFIDKVVPPAEQSHMSETLLRLLNSGLYELNNLARERDGLPPLAADDAATMAFMTPAVVALSDSFHYPAPVIFMPQTFEQKQASVFQVTRTPGRTVVYLGCVCLIVGVFTMLYIRERRVWVWLQDSQWSMALSSTRQTLELDQEFDNLRHHVSTNLQTSSPA